MTWMHEGWRRLRALAGRRDFESGLDEELRFHLEQQTARNLGAGMSPDEAHRQARLRFGPVERAREQARDEFRLGRLEDLSRDVRHALRALRRARGFTTAAALTIGLGIGATATVFSVVHGVLLKPLPYPDADRLVSLSHAAPGLTAAETDVAPTMWFTYRDGTRTFEAVGLWTEGAANVLGPAGPEEVRRLLVTHDTLEALAVQPTTGRWFMAADDVPGAPETALLTYGYWQRRFGGDPSIRGRTLTIDGRLHEIVGVMPRGFKVGRSDHDVIQPLRLDRDALVLGSFSYHGVARLRPRVSLEAARADTARLIPIWLGAWPLPPGVDAAAFESARVTPVLRPLKDAIVGDVRPLLWIVMATIVVVWLIACANVTNLLLVRAEGRQQELAVRAAMGAGRMRIARSLLVEGLLLGLLGGAVGMALAGVGVRVIVALEPQGLPRLEELGVDAVVLLFGLAASLLSGLLFSAIPIARYARPQVSVALRGNGRTMSDSRERLHARSVLVVAQVGLALVLLASAGLMIRTFQALRTVEPGIADPAHLQALRIAMPAGEIDDPEQVTRLQQAIRDRLAAVAGVSAVSFGTSAPLEDANNWDPLFIEGQAYTAGQLPPVRNMKRVAPGYFDTVGTPIVAGRDLTWADVYHRRPVALISENLAREVWGRPDLAVGRRVREAPEGIWREVIGVVGDVHDAGMHLAPPSTVHWPVLTEGLWENGAQAVRAVTFVVRSERAGTEGLLGNLRGAVHEVSGGLPIGRVLTVADLYERSMALTSFALVMLGIAATMALTLGVIGIYGVVAYAVAQRTREIAIRLALGAQPGSVRGLFLRDGMRLAGVGVACGLVMAVASTRLMSSMLFGVSALDPVTYLAGSLILMGAAAAASVVPALLATRGSIATRLRAE